MPPGLTYSTTASSSYTIGGTATGGTVDWTTSQWDADRIVYNVAIPDSPFGAETTAYRWINGAALERAMEIIRREQRKEPDQNKIKELL